MSALKRFTAGHPCPVCGGYDTMPRSRGERCYGYTLSADDPYARCTREELAGGLEQNDDGTYSHLLAGSCGCGREHGPAEAREAELRHEIRDVDGRLLAVHCRKGTGKGKRIWWQGPHGERGLNGARPADMLYRAETLRDADLDLPVIVPEGEVAAIALAALGLVTVATVTGAGVPGAPKAISPAAARLLAGRHVVLWPDADEVGEAHMNACAAVLAGVSRSVSVIHWPEAPPAGDAADFCAGRSRAEAEEGVLEMVKLRRPVDANASAETEDLPLPDLDEWPDPPAEAAFHGLAGEFVRLVEPHTEADSAAVLVDFLVLAGNAIGRTAHVKVGAAAHYCNTYTVIVGESGAAGRKGTAFTEARRLFAQLPPGCAGRIVGGVVSGEGIVWAVRDAIYKRERDRTTKEISEVMVDPGIDDKRLVLRESEFSQVLRVAGRDSNITSATLRQAWDDEDVLRTLAKNSPATATGAHISMIGDITPAELRRELTATDKANGFANRILWCCSRRSKELPDPSPVDLSALTALSAHLQEVVSEARFMGPVTRDEEASTVWREAYSFLTRDRSGGLIGSLLARAEAQVLRLSLIYAVLDGSQTICREHLEAAIALWDYSERSAVFIFGDALGDPVADELLDALRRRAEEGLTRNEMRDHFGRHRSSREIAMALALLERARLVEMRREETAGRPRERWFVVREKREKRGKPRGPES